MFYRRIRRSELDQLKELCDSDLKWRKYFDAHLIWLLKALDEFSLSDRVVFGAFEPVAIEGDKILNKLSGCLFLKHSEFESKIELKNLILPSDKLAKGDYSDAKMLIEKTVRFCEIRNVEKIEIELPQEEHNIIAIFLKFDFRIVSIRDRYKTIKPVCILERTIGDAYYGDPFDNGEFAKWLLRQFLPCEILQIDTNDNFKIHFESKAISKAFSKENPVGNSKRLRGIMSVLENSENGTIDIDIDHIVRAPKKETLKIIFVDDYLNDAQKIKLANNNYIFFDKNDAKQIAGGEMSSMSTPIDVSDVGGAITVLEYDKIMLLYEQTTTTYYLFSGICAGLNISGSTNTEKTERYNEDDSIILAVYCPNWKSNEHGIVGFFEIQAVEIKKFKKALNEPVPTDSALSREDLHFYHVYSEEANIAELKCGRLCLFERPFSITNSSWISTKEMQDYLKREIIENGSNSTYIDCKSCEELKKHKSQSQRQYTDYNTDKNNSDMLSGLIAALGAVADLFTIGDITKKQIDQWQLDLKQDDPKVEKKLAGSLLNNIVTGCLVRLEGAVKEYTTLINAQYLDDYEKRKHSKIISIKTVEFLVSIQSIKKEVRDYDEILNFFISIKDSN